MTLSLFLASVAMIASIFGLVIELRTPGVTWRSRSALLFVAMLLVMVPKVFAFREAFVLPTVMLGFVLTMWLIFQRVVDGKAGTP